MRPLVVTAATLTLLTAGCSGPVFEPWQPVASPSVSSSAVPGSADRQQAVEAVLRTRSAAVLADDVGRWTSTQTVTAAVPSWSAVAPLPLVLWAYDDLLVTGAGPDAARATGVLRFRLEGEPSDSAAPVALGLVRGPSGWLVASETTDGAARPLWDVGTSVTARDGVVTVVGIDMEASDTVAVARTASNAAAAVSAAWSPVPEVVVVLTRTRDQQARGLGRSPVSLDGLAAVTTAAGAAPGVPDREATSRIWISGEEWARLGPVSRSVVLRHELLHVVTGSAAIASAPLWLEEGSAELVGYRGSGVGLRAAVRDELARVRTDGPPPSLPSDDDLAGERSREAYQAAHVACAVIVDEVGLRGLRRLYEKVATSDGTPAAVDRALREVTGAGTDALTRRWQQQLLSLAGR